MKALHLMKTSALIAALALPLSACMSPSIVSQVGTDKQAATQATGLVVPVKPLAATVDPQVTGGSVDADNRARAQSAPAVLRRAARPWIGATSVAMGANERLPSVFTEPVKLAFEDAATGGRVPLGIVASRITKLTGVPVSVRADVYRGVEQPAQPAANQIQVNAVPLPSLDGQTRAATPLPMPAPVSPQVDTSLSALEMRWSGTLEAFLERITDRLGLSWEYRDGVVVIERFRTESFEVALGESETQYSLGLNSSDQTATGQSAGGGGGGLSASNATADVTERGKGSVVGSILKGINHIIASSPGSSATQSDGSGRLSVTTTKDAMQKVRAYVRDENNAMLRQAQIQFDIYSVKRSDADEKGVDWSLVYRSLSGNYGVGIASPASLVSSSAGTLNFQILSTGSSDAAQRLGDSTAMLKLLATFGTTATHKPVSLLSLNRQWARKASLNSRAYVSETTPAASGLGGTSSPGLKTATVTSGDRYLAMPQILDSNVVVLKFGLGLSSLIDIPRFTSGSGVTQQSVQTPEVANVIDQATVALKPGQVLAITGMSRIVSKDDTSSLTEGAPVIAGGSKRVSREREDFIILVRSTIL